MLEMKTGFTLPPVIRRLGRCGQEGEHHASSAKEDDESKSSQRQSPGQPHREERQRLFLHGGAAATGSNRVRTFVNGIVTPFTACLQPSVDPCGAGCEPPECAFEKQHALVTPLTDRTIPFRDSRYQREPPEDYRHYHLHYHQRAPGSYHSQQSYAHQSAAAAAASLGASATNPTSESGRVGHPSDESTSYDKKKRSTDISKPRSSDIICGRGGSSNKHPGNIQFRGLVAANKQVYVGLTKKQKMLVARKIVDAIHSTGGKFLAKDMDTGLFYDIGLPRSLEKTSQALREKNSNEMPFQSTEGEGIETSVESHNEVIQNENKTSTNGSKQTAGESTVGTSPSASKNSKNSNTKAPPLVIPPQLMKIFGPKGSKRDETEWEKHNHSPTKHSTSDPPYDGYRYCYPPSPYSPPTHYPGYPPVPGHPSFRASHPVYPGSPVPPNAHYRPHPQYYYQGHQEHPPHSPHYGWHGRVPDERFSYHPAHDDCEAYSSEHYSRPTEYHQGISRSPPQGKPPSFPSLYNQYPSRHASPRPYDPPPMPPPQHSGHTSPPSQMPHRRSMYSPVYFPRDGASTSWGLPDPIAPRRILHRKTNNGHVRESLDVSPLRQRDLKRPRNGETQSDASLSSAVSKSLSLDERVVGREREQQMRQQRSPGPPPTAGKDSDQNSPHKQLVSPSSLLQSSARTRGSPSGKKQDLSTLSGLAALSTAAFLKLDEDEAKK
eukprot:CAMPEP_0172366466 /NCGR_PEP_ID=MMETSP1060-20121228/15428_1 /TAXON_ID=37318 /ORGANISM="Pseudo-nitzschia pungens, Strain cf. cingulata" /LENGTH=717 /DNA_ID=CAMNT_0013090331 /DNA_START=184 /DNA_END=2337 /DNA_ORIENTATION=-